jgi:hypothetical protein
MSITVNGTTGLNFPDGTSQPTAGYVPFRNKLINGDMRIAQRGTSASVSATGYYTVDRWIQTGQATLGTVGAVVSQSSLAPTGFTKSYQYTNTTALTGDLTGTTITVAQHIEQSMIQDFVWGTASAAAVTISFWVRSSVAGLFGGSLRDGAQTRSYAFSYTISSSNTWEYKTITIPGDVAGTWVENENALGLRIHFAVGVGSVRSATPGTWLADGQILSATGAVNLATVSGATFNITGVQLEKAAAATAFEHRPIGTELALCQRYYYQQNGNSSSQTPICGAFMRSSTLVVANLRFPVKMRTTPTLTSTNSTDAFHMSTNSDWGINTLSIEAGGNYVNADTISFSATLSSGGSSTAGHGGQLYFRANSSFFYSLSAEL